MPTQNIGGIRELSEFETENEHSNQEQRFLI
jgi:hypothetical protein